MSDLAFSLDALFRWMMEAGERAAKSRRPEVRDAYYACAAKVAHEMHAHGLKTSEEAPRGD